MVLDARAGGGEELAVRVATVMVPWVYLMDESIRVGGQQAQKADVLSGADAPLPPLRATRDTTLVAFLLDPTAPASRAGTISGQ